MVKAEYCFGDTPLELAFWKSSGEDNLWEGWEGDQPFKFQKKNDKKGKDMDWLKSKVCMSEVQLANPKQLGDHYASKHPKEKPPSESE
ncbi:hypothetical protein FNV43_RR08605 [Rhamnella rubrinervis]|uniref:Uncharacterized protein n=1 Tax=Rhamnella rubrinervis TaxID=2594499 RepID=A0A8K0H9N5_9ROSA|nr:hypothetical protein FNV43_RR08605 [Rhamnella rubrinervis]